MKKFEIIYHRLESDINKGVFSAGEKLPTEQDICREFQVSRITAMRALNELENKKLITRTAGRGSFVAKKAHRNLQGYHLIVPQLQTFYYSSMADAFCRTLKDLKTKGAIHISEYESDYIEDLLFSLKKMGTQGVAIVPSGDISKMGFLNNVLSELSCSVTVVSRELRGFHGNQIIVDEEFAGAAAVEYFYRRGHRAIAYAGNCKGYTSSILRYQGFQQGIKKYGLTQELCPRIPNVDPIAIHSLRHIFTQTKRPTAIVTADEFTAVHLFDLLQNIPINVPGDVAILSLDGGTVGASMEVPLTTIDFPGAEIGKRVARDLFAQETKKRIVKIKPTLTPRQSCGSSPHAYRHDFLRNILK